MRRAARAGLVALLLVAAIAVQAAWPAPAAATPGQIFGPFAGKPYASVMAKVGLNGNVVVYASQLLNFDPKPVPPRLDLGIYYRDRGAGQTGSVVRGLAGALPNGSSVPLAVSPDAATSFVLYRSSASNLVADDTLGHDDIFLAQRVPGVSERVSISSTEQQANGPSTFGAMSGNTTTGNPQYVVFTSAATNLVADDTNGNNDVFVRDRTAGTTERVSLADNEAQANGDAAGVAISDNGRYVAFLSAATNLVVGDTNGYQDVFVRDRQLGTTTRVSVGHLGQASGWSAMPTISANGRFVAFESDADDIVPLDENIGTDVFVHDRTTGSTERVSVGTDGQEGFGDAANPSMSRDGRFIAFETDAEEFSALDTNWEFDIYVRDRLGRVTRRATEKTNGAEAFFGVSTSASISPDGRWVGFDIDTEELTCESGCDTNDDWDVYLKDMTSAFVTNPTVGALFQGVSPARILDTRFGPVPTGWTVGAKLSGGNTLDLPVTGGVTGVPSNATAVVLNVTSAEATTASGYVTVGPTGAIDANTSSLNLQPGAAVPNLITSKVGTNGRVSLYTNTGSVNLIVDVFGYYAPDAGDFFTGVQPTRVLDTRDAPVPPSWNPGQSLVGGHPSWGQMDLTVAGVGDVPASARAVVLNVTSTQATTGNGFVTVGPAGSLNINTSNLNLQPGYNVPNLAIVKTGSGGKVTLFTNVGHVHLVVDVVGYYGPFGDDLFFPLNPSRILDTRASATNTLVPKLGPLGAGGTAELPVAGASAGGVPANARAVVMNVTSTQASSNGGFTTVWPAGSEPPLASSLNYRVGVNVPNGVQVKLGAAGRVGFYNGVGTVHLLSDVNGYFR